MTTFFKNVAHRLSKMFFLNMVLSTLFSNAIQQGTKPFDQHNRFPWDLHNFFNDCFFLFITN